MTKTYINNTLDYKIVMSFLRDLKKHGINVNFTRELTNTDFSCKSSVYNINRFPIETRYIEYHENYKPYIDVIMEYYHENDYNLIRRLKQL